MINSDFVPLENSGTPTFIFDGPDIDREARINNGLSISFIDEKAFVLTRTAWPIRCERLLMLQMFWSGYTPKNSSAGESARRIYAALVAMNVRDYIVELANEVQAETIADLLR